MGTTQRKTAAAHRKVRIQGETTEQTVLASAGVLVRLIVTGNAAITAINVSDGPASTIATSSIANPTVITTDANHNLTSGDSVVILGHSGSTPSINGTHIVTVTAPTTFTIDVNVSVGGTGGSINTINIIETTAIDETKVFEFGCIMDSGIYINPTAVTTDVTVVYDG